MALDLDLMPAATLGDDSDEEERRRREAAGGGLLMPSAITPGSSTPRPVESPGTMTMPPAGGYAQPDANAPAASRTMEPGSREYKLAIGAASQPKMPAATLGAPPAPPEMDTTKMPAATLPTEREQPSPPRPSEGGMRSDATPTSINALASAAIGPAAKAYQDLQTEGRPGSPEGPKLAWWKKALDAVSQISPIGRTIEANIPGSPGNYDARLNRAALAAAREQGFDKERQNLDTLSAQALFNTPEKRRAYLERNPEQFSGADEFEKNDWVLSGKFPQREPAQPKDADKKIDEYVNDQGQRVLTFQKADGSTYDRVGGKVQTKTTHTSPFEAFAYGTADERKAAQDFLDMEKRLGSRYRNPTEFEEKFRLFKEDPETYRSMFGDKSGNGPDRATATRMLTYFDKRRHEVQSDFTLDDAQKADQLKEIGNLEQPFLDAVQPGAAGNKDNDRVEVISPNGQRGTVPRSQLGKAKKKGYREVQ